MREEVKSKEVLGKRRPKGKVMRYAQPLLVAHIGSVKLSTEVFALQHTEVLEDGKPYSFITHSVVAHIVKQTKKEDSEN